MVVGVQRPQHDFPWASENCRCAYVSFLLGFLAGKQGGAGRYQRAPRVRWLSRGRPLCLRLPGAREVDPCPRLVARGLSVGS